jgi:hypothetical protein
MKLFPKIVTSVVFATITTASMSAISHAATISKQLEFTTSNQSIWDTGPASTFTWGGQDGFLGLDWDNSSGVGRIRYRCQCIYKWQNRSAKQLKLKQWLS